jgi:glycosyltransferase involved in cell wall biosynthesis
MRFFTCTPVAFGGGADFFARDSGLLCRGFQSLGVESRAVMPGERKPEDDADLIRTEYGNLESADWWCSHNLDGVVLYAWGRPKFRKVAAAIHNAGIFLVLNQDSGGLASPLAGLREWLTEQWTLGGQGRGFSAWMRFLRLASRGMTVGLVVTDPLRATHLGVGDIIACVSPKAAGHYRRLCRIYGGHDLAERVKVIPHAVESGFHFAGTSKLRQIACIGRWEDHIQKRTWLMMEVIRCLVAKDESLSVMIVGNVTPEMDSWHRSLGESRTNRIHLCGHLDRSALVEVLRSSRVFYSPSAFESFGIAAAEALCCGCSVVAGRSVSMASFEWFVSENSGALAVPDDAAGHIRSLEQELGAWDQNLREPENIAQIWGERLHAGSVAELVLQYHRLSKKTEPIVG